MKREEVINQLESLKCHCTSMAECGESDSEWCKDVKALEVAIDAIKRTAQEVPVQEQQTDWTEKLAKELSIRLPIHDILSK